MQFLLKPFESFLPKQGIEMKSIFNSVDFGIKSDVVGFDFWSEPKKSSPVRRAKLNLINFWAAAVMAVALNTSVWAEMSNMPSQAVRTNNYSQISEAANIFAVGDALAARQGTAVSFSVVDAPVRVSDFKAIQLTQVTSSAEEPLLSVDNGRFSSAETVSGETAYFKPSLSQSVKDLVGENGVQRLEEFSKATDGWDGRGSHALKPKSIETLNRFFGGGDFAPADVAVFMSRSGLIVANWPLNDHFVELEFSEERISYFFAADDSEGTVERNVFGDFKRTLATFSNVAPGAQNQS